MIRIIGGRFKGKKLNFINNDITRPLRDLVKENIFNLIEHSNNLNIDLYNAKVLDIFSGTGSFGLECLSRGAQEVVFIENNKTALNILNKNIKQLSLETTASIFSYDVFKFFSENNKNTFQIIFLDPPYKDTTFLDLLPYFKRYKVAGKDLLIIIHREKTNNESYKNLLNVILVKKYGRSKIIFGSLV